MKWGLLAFFIVFSVTDATSTTLSLSTVLKKLEANEKKMNSVQFDFKQLIEFISQDMSSRVEGTAFFKKPKKLKIIRKYPQHQITISNGKNMWVYNPQFNQVWEGASDSWIHSAVLPKGIIPVNSYVRDLKKKFNLSIMEDGSESELVHLKAIPKNEIAGYYLEIHISDENWFPVETIYFSESAKIKTSFSKISQNPELKEDVFKFIAPEGTEVISLN